MVGPSAPRGCFGPHRSGQPLNARRCGGAECREVTPMALSEDIVSAVANANFKSMAEMQLTNSLNHQARLQILAESSLGQVLERMNTLDPTESAGVSGVISADLAEKIG